MFSLALLAFFAVPSLASPMTMVDSINLFSRATSSECTATGTTSCHNTTSVSNLCCFESPGGLLLQTQFWDTNPSTGPTNSWTIHGLWPDNCDTTFTENCDPSRAYTGIASLLTANGASDTLAFMQSLWVDINGNNEQFWEHEWSTHGTCMSSVRSSQAAFPAGAQRELRGAVAFFQTVVRLFKSLPTYTWLANAGITPSATQTHTLASLTSALTAASGGFTPALDCNSGNLNAISWYFNLQGSIIDGTFVPIAAPEAGSCPSTGIKYPLKSGSATPTTTSGGPTTTAGGLPGSAIIHGLQSGSSIGGLLSLGTWSTQTLATFTLSGTASSFTMTSSKGNCGVSSGTFACGSGVALTSFSAVTSGGNLLLASGASTTFSSDGNPSGSTVFTVFTGSSHTESYTLSIVGS